MDALEQGVQYFPTLGRVAVMPQPRERGEFLRVRLIGRVGRSSSTRLSDLRPSAAPVCFEALISRGNCDDRLCVGVAIRDYVVECVTKSAQACVIATACGGVAVRTWLHVRSDY